MFASLQVVGAKKPKCTELQNRSIYKWKSGKPYWGKTISTMGMIDFWPEKKLEQFFVHQGFLPFSESPISI
jgi:hypothetical protein